MCIRAVIIFTVLAALLGCDKPQSVSSRETKITRVEIYYRGFDTLSPISHSKSDLVRAAPFKLSINEADPIYDFLRLLPSRCDHLQGISENRMDYYLLAKMFNNERLEREFGSSGLGFVDGKIFPGKVCQLSQHDREVMESWLQTKLTIAHNLAWPDAAKRNPGLRRD